MFSSDNASQVAVLVAVFFVVALAAIGRIRALLSPNTSWREALSRKPSLPVSQETKEESKPTFSMDPLDVSKVW